jgi:hypothetical protein
MFKVDASCCCETADFDSPDTTQKNSKIIRTVAIELPMEILVKIMTFVSVGRVSKAWSMAMSTGKYNTISFAISQA